MNYLQRVGITSISIVGLVALASLPLIAQANEGSKNVNRPITNQRVEVAINADGKVLVRGAKVTGISGSTLTVTTTAGASTLSWAVTTDGSTTFITSTGSGSTLSAISVGDTVSFAGALTGSGLSVKASAVKNWTLGASERSVAGTVQSINSAGTSLVVGNGKDGDNDNKKAVTVQFTASTAVLLNGAVSTFASIQTGDKVKATGVANADGTILTAASVTVTHPAVQFGNDDFGKKIRLWFSNHGFGFGGKNDKSRKDD